MNCVEFVRLIGLSDQSEETIIPQLNFKGRLSVLTVCLLLAPLYIDLFAAGQLHPASLHTFLIST